MLVSSIPSAQPEGDADDDTIQTEKKYKICHDISKLNADFPFSEVEPERQWRVHTCFELCKPTDPALIDDAFSVDERPDCLSSHTDNDGMLCLNPYENECEVLQLKT